MTIPDVSAAEGVVTHWVRLYSKDSDVGVWPDSIDCAIAAIVEPLFGEADYQDHGLRSAEMNAFCNGAALGARLALAVAAAPLGVADDAFARAVQAAKRDIEYAAHRTPHFSQQ